MKHPWTWHDGEWLAQLYLFSSWKHTTVSFSVFFQCKASHTSSKWMVKGSRIVLWCSRACWLCLPSPEPVWLLEWSCACGDILHDPFKALGVVDPCPWVWYPQWCLWRPRFCRLQSLHKVSTLPVLNFPANGNLITYFKELKWWCMCQYKPFAV